MDKLIKGYERYTIDHKGAIRDHKEKKRIVPTLTTKGHYKVYLENKQGEGKWFLVEELLAQAFLPNPLNLKHVRIKNGDPKDLRANNLEWYADFSEMSYMEQYEYEKKKQELPKSRVLGSTATLTQKSPVLQLDYNGNILAEFPTIRAAADALGISKDNICHAINGDRMGAGGYRWQRAGNEFIESEKVREWQAPQYYHKVKITQYTLDGDFVAEYPSIYEAGRATGIAHYLIQRASLTSSRIYGGYKWVRDHYDYKKDNSLNHKRITKKELRKGYRQIRIAAKRLKEVKKQKDEK